MIINSSSDLKYNSTLEVLKTHFGRDEVTRQEVIEYVEKSGNKIPTKFWSAAKIGRGLYSLKDAPQEDVPNVHVIKPTVVNHPERQVTNVVSRFEYDSLIPKEKSTFVPWGNYKDVFNMIESKRFFALYITGESGSGKNEMIAQACAANKRPMVRVSITRDTKEDHLIGSKTLVDGNIMYEEGPVVWAAENGAVLICDELSLADPNEIMCLQNALEGEPFFVKSANRLVTPVEGFCVIATDNTKGRGSDSGRYIGTNILNDAFLERFAMTMEQGYPKANIEKEIFTRLMAKNGKQEDVFIKDLVDWMQVIRKTYDEEGIEEQITTRRGCHIINTYCMFGNEKKAIELCTNRFDETTKDALLILWEKMKTGEVKAEQE